MNIFTGSFDPPTHGHRSIIYRAANLLGSLTVVVCDNLTKKHMFSLTERYDMVSHMVENIPGVSVDMLTPGKMLASYIEATNVKVLVRGLRNSIDLEYERTIEDFVKEYGVKEVVYLLNDPGLANVSSSAVRNHLLVMKENGCMSHSIHNYVPKSVAQDIGNSPFTENFGVRHVG